MSSVSWLAWAGFGAFVLAMLALDLGVFHRKAHVVSLKESLRWSAVWISLALIFNLGLYWWQGRDAALQFFTGYLIEKSLSVDNIFVFLMIFSYFQVPARLQHKVLFWGILGALAMRAVFVWAGVALMQRFHWMIYVFGGLLIFTGIRMVLVEEREEDLEGKWLLRTARRLIPVTKGYEGERFFVVRDGKRMATPLFLTLLLIEATDVIFAVDSIPAILAISSDAFIVYTSNVFAILGLRSLYFAIAGLMPLFHYLKQGLSFILVFVGAKMVLAEVYPFPLGLALGVVAGTLILSVVASLLWPRKDHPRV